MNTKDFGIHPRRQARKKYSNRAAKRKDPSTQRSKGPYTENAAAIIACRSARVACTRFFRFRSNSSCSSGVRPCKAAMEKIVSP